jgi:hypothetical protein
MFCAHINDDTADLSNIVTQHQIPAKGAGNVCYRIIDGIAGTQPVRRIEFYAFVTANHGVQDVNCNELSAATTLAWIAALT